MPVDELRLPVFDQVNELKKSIDVPVVQCMGLLPHTDDYFFLRRIVCLC